MSHRLITLTGLDRTGKCTQTRLLSEALQPSLTMSFPEYANYDGKGGVEGHWAAEFVRAALNGEHILLRRASEVGENYAVYAGPELAVSPTKKNPYIFQMWQAADRIDKVDWIRETLEHSHIVADRHSIDALAYGLVDGCDLGWLLAMDKLYHPTDLNIVLVGKPFPRPGEVPDINERDSTFQQRVRDAYEGLAKLFPEKVVLLDIDPHRPIFTTPGWVLDSVCVIHYKICWAINRNLGLEIQPLSVDAIAEVLPQFAPEKAPVGK